MIVNKEALDKLSVEISTTFLECENPTEVRQLYAYFQNLINEQSDFMFKKINIDTINK